MDPKIIPLYGQPEECGQMKATVKGMSNERVMIDTGVGVVSARVAFSCLVAPEIDDTVLVNYVDNDYYVLAILERSAKHDMTLAFPANVKLQAMSGQVDMVSTRDINLTTTATARILSTDMHMTSANMNVTAGKLTSRTNEIESHTQTLKLFAHTLSTAAKQISQKTDILVRWVETVETLNIGSLIQNIRKNFTSHSDLAMITANKDVRIDGERIHMG